MCGICGVLSKRGDNVVPVLRCMMSCMTNRGPDGAGIAADAQIIHSSSFAALNLREISGDNVLGHLRLAIVGGTCGAQPFRSCDGRLTLEHNGEIYNYKAIKSRLKMHDFKTQTDSEVIVHLLEDYVAATGGDVLAALEMVAADLDGIYALAIKDEETGTIYLARDKVGVRQLYYSEDKNIIAFSSERKSLWAAGLHGPIRRVMPGCAVIISPDGNISQHRLIRVTGIPEVSFRTVNSAVKAYKKAFISSVEKRTQDLERIGVIFSGGIDSVMVASLAKKMVPEVTCYTCGMKGSSDVDYAVYVANKLGLNLHVNQLDVADVERLIPEIMHIIEDTNAGQVEVALPIYGAIKLAHEHGIKVMLSGQGADELFAGYSWYSQVAGKEGYHKLRQYMNQDFLLLYKETLEREDKIAMSHSIEVRNPYLDQGVTEMAFQIDPRLNVRGKHDKFGKRVHRKLGVELDIPRNIAYRVKEAAQHGSGVHDALDFIARKNGFDESTTTKDYLTSLESRERMGSSQRYGFLFDKERSKWTVLPHVQMYLDSVSGKLQHRPL